METDRTRQEHQPFNPSSLLHNLEHAESQWQAQDPPLPIAQKQEEIRGLIHKYDSILLEADTGSGKSTIAPALFLHELLLHNPEAKVLVTQPRRIATRSVSEFVGETIGKQFVDYRYKSHSITKPNSKLHFTVEQSLLNDLVKDETLSEYDAVMIDEVHERSANIDIIIPLLKRAQKARVAQGKKPLKVIMASGTMDGTLLANYFEGAHREHIEGRAFTVTQDFAEKDFKAWEMPKAAAKKAAEFVIDEKEKGDILIFMPGKSEIDNTIKEIGKLITDPNIEVVMIMGRDQGGKDPYEIIKNNPHNKQRIYVATDAAETSITIPKITVVIDSGLMRKNVYDPETRVTTLETFDHTQANWKQRIGRAGRVQPGKAFALFTKESLDKRKEGQQAELLRTDLSPHILKMKASNIHDVYNFDYIEHPGKERIDQAVYSLQQLGALDNQGNITELGEKMAEIDDDPRYARMLLEAKKRDCLDVVTQLISFMKTKDPLFTYDKRYEKFTNKYRDYIDIQSDFVTVLNVWNDVLAAQNANETFNWGWKGINQHTFDAAIGENKNMRTDPFFENEEVPMKKFDLTPQGKEAIYLSLAAGLMPNLLIRENNISYKFQSGASSQISLDSRSALATSTPQKMLCGKLDSRQKEQTETRALMNMTYDQEKIVSAFDYLRDFIQLEPKIVPENQSLLPESQKNLSTEQTETSPTSSAEISSLSHELANLQSEITKQATPSHDEDTKNVHEPPKTIGAKIKQAWINFWKRIQKALTGK